MRSAGSLTAETSQARGVAPNAYRPDHNGEDFTRPQNYFEMRIEGRTPGCGNPTGTYRFIPRFGGCANEVSFRGAAIFASNIISWRHSDRLPMRR